MLKAPINAHAPELIKSPVDGLDVDIEKIKTPTPMVNANKLQLVLMIRAYFLTILGQYLFARD